MQDIYQIANSLFDLKIIGCEEVLTKVFDLADSLLDRCRAPKVTLKYGNLHQIALHPMTGPFLSNFVESARQISRVTCKRIEK